ncbi:hypothetical protein C4J85_3259 [Pseudomonas sp. R4-34-07]|nr:hypothetical protein C4J85_3259 [Pseudomonas sp. R4-34-07]
MADAEHFGDVSSQFFGFFFAFTSTLTTIDASMVTSAVSFHGRVRTCRYSG